MTPRAIVVGLDSTDTQKHIAKLREDRKAVFGGLVGKQSFVAVSLPGHLMGVKVDPTLVTFTDSWEANPQAPEIVEALRVRTVPIVAGFVHEDYKPRRESVRRHW